MRLLSTIALMAALIPGCHPRSSQLSEADYPTVVGTGRFVQFESVDGNYGLCFILYTDEDNLLREYSLRMEQSGDYLPDAVTIPEPLYPGNHIVITRTGDSTYTVSKVE